MFTYEATWSHAAVRRFIQRVGVEALPDLLALREADNVGSGTGPETHGFAELRRRIQAELDAAVALDRRGLAVHGDDLMAELGIPAGPTLGRILDELLERVVADPSLNDRPTLLLLAEAMLAEDG
jgi:poly(A) polymerase/tRNA nucleotidyltransferase (CCA-adding enzyme)